MASLNIPEDAVAGIVQKMILDSITPEARDAIFTQALEWMTKPQTTGYLGGKNVSPLQEAFQLAMRGATQRLVAEMIETDPEVRTFVDTELRALIRDFSRQLDENTSGELRSVLIEAMVDHLAQERSRY
jgi:hypothetical protein